MAMIKLGNSAPTSQPSLGIFGILRESFKTTNRNGKLLFPILLVVFLSFSQLDFAQDYILKPVANDFSLQLAKYPNMFQDMTSTMNNPMYSHALLDLRELLQVKLLIKAFSWSISLLFLVAVVSSSSEAYTAKVLSVKDLFLKIRKSWAKPIVTSFYMFLITVGMVVLYVLALGIISILVPNSWVLLSYGVLFVSFPVFYVYITALWMVSVVVSVLEDGYGGLKATGRAGELMKGKKVQASLIVLLFGIAYTTVYLMTNYFSSYNLSTWSRLAITIPFTNGLNCILKIFMFVVFTVFYHEQKMRHDEKEIKGLYVPIAAGEA